MYPRSLLQRSYALIGILLWAAQALSAGAVCAQERVWLGIELQQLTQGRAHELGLETDAGAVVTRVRPGTPADSAGMRAGDVILAIAGQSLATTKAIVDRVKAQPAGNAVDVTIWRDGARRSFSATVEKVPEAIELYTRIETLALEAKHAEVAALAARFTEIADAAPALAPGERAQAYERLASALGQLSRWPEEEALRRRALLAWQELFGADHVTVARALTSLGDNLRNQKKYPDALASFQRAIAMFEQVQGADHPELAWPLSRAANSLYWLDRYGEAEVLYRRSLAIREQQYDAEKAKLTGTTDSAAVAQLGRLQLAVARGISDLADNHRAQKRYQEALLLYARALAGREAVQGIDHPDHAWDLSRSGDTLFYLNRFAEAEGFYRRSLAIREKQHGPDNVALARPIGDLADTLRQGGRYREAAELYRRKLALEERSTSQDSSSIGNTLNWLATTLRHEARYEEAATFARRAAELNARIGQTERAGWSHFELAANLRWMMRLEEAQTEFAKAAEILARALPAGDTGLAIVMFGQSQVLMELARYPEAEAIARKVLAIREAVDGPEHAEVARALQMLGYILNALDRPAEAEPLYRRALAIAERVWGGDHPEVAAGLSSLAYVLYMRSSYEEAEQLSRRALLIRERAFGADHYEIATSLAVTTSIMRYTNRVAEAVPLARRRVAIIERAVGADHPAVASALNSLGLLLERTDQSADAPALYARALEIRRKAFGDLHPDVAWNLNRLGLAAENAKRWEEALGYYRKASAIVSNRALSTQPHQRTTYDEADQTKYVFRNLVDAAFELALERPDIELQLLDEAFMAAQWRARTQTSEALLQMSARQAIGNPELAALVREGQDLRTRWAAAERRLVQAAGRDGASADDAAEAAEAGREFTAVERRLDEISQEISRRDPAFAELSSAAPLSIAQAQALIGDNEALAFFLQTGSDTYVWAVTRGAVSWSRLGLGSARLDAAVDKVRCGLDRSAWTADEANQCRRQIGASFAPKAPGASLLFDLGAAHELYTDLFATIEDLTAGRHLMIVPSGPLTQLPFQALVAEPPPVGRTREDFRGVAWLGHRQPITVLPGVSALRALRQDARPSRATRPLLSFANPTLDGRDGPSSDDARAARAATSCAAAQQAVQVARAEGRGVPALTRAFRGAQANLTQIRALTPLPETVDETCQLAQGMGATEEDLWFAGRATERNLKALSENGRLATYKVVHFATHGLVAGGADELQASLAEPALVLTPPPDDAKDEELAVDDGLLTASEVSALKLDADWVILSACNTAAGNASGADALSGLARAFLYAGARALLVSHWEVDSHAAVRLVTGAFSAQRETPGLGRAEALRQSILTLTRDPASPHFSHPMYWAPFVVIGEGR